MAPDLAAPGTGGGESEDRRSRMSSSVAGEALGRGIPGGH